MNSKPLKKLEIFKLLKKIKICNIKDEKIELSKSYSRILSYNVISQLYLPPFNNSAVDGYAIHKKDINNYEKIKCCKRIIAGENKIFKAKPGEAIRIFTGASMPMNSKTVVMQENIKILKDYIYINKSPKYGENCRLKGEDISKGDIILKKGQKITNTNLNLIAAIGKKNILVREKLRIGFYTSGNELVRPTEKLKGSQINNSNFYSLKSLLNEPLFKSKYLGNLKDNKRIITDSLIKNTSKYDVIITAGGASVGDEDYLIRIVKEIGKIFLWKAAIKPGRPLAIGKINNTVIICLPGNPVSVHLLYGMIIRPYLEFLCGAPLRMPVGIPVVVNFSMKKKTQRLEWLRVVINPDQDYLSVNKYLKQGSGMISSIANSHGIIEIPENISQINCGDNFVFYPYNLLF